MQRTFLTSHVTKNMVHQIFQQSWLASSLKISHWTDNNNNRQNLQTNQLQNSDAKHVGLDPFWQTGKNAWPSSFMCIIFRSNTQNQCMKQIFGYLNIIMNTISFLLFSRVSSSNHSLSL